MGGHWARNILAKAHALQYGQEWLQHLGIDSRLYAPEFANCIRKRHGKARAMPRLFPVGKQFFRQYKLK